MTGLTITALRTTLLRVSWPQTPWLKGYAFGDARNLLGLDVETKGGIDGMGYLAVATALEETILPRVIGKDATAVEASGTIFGARPRQQTSRLRSSGLPRLERATSRV
jgi:hypothetical protein